MPVEFCSSVEGGSTDCEKRSAWMASAALRGPQSVRRRQPARSQRSCRCYWTTGVKVVAIQVVRYCQYLGEQYCDAYLVLYCIVWTSTKMIPRWLSAVEVIICSFLYFFQLRQVVSVRVTLLPV